MLARLIHHKIGKLDRAIPVKEIAQALDITEIKLAEMDGCEGVLLTDRARSRGPILVNNQPGPQAARFGIAHELGHFLMERHELGLNGIMRCTKDDFRQSRTDRKNRKQEVEANEFAISLLAPAYKTAPIFAQQPDIASVEALSCSLNLSLEAAVRCLVDGHDEPLAAVWTSYGRIRYTVRGPKFPWLVRSTGEDVSKLSRTHGELAKQSPLTSKMSEVATSIWTDAEISELYEQVRVGKNGLSLTLLWATLGDETEED